MALRHRIMRFASTSAARSLLFTASFRWSASVQCLSASQIPTRSFAQAKKSKNKTSGPPPVADDDADFEGGDAEDGGAAKALAKANKNMKGAIVNFTRALNQMRPGRADAGIFDELHVQAYGQHVPLAQVAQVAVVGTHRLSVTVYDPSLMETVRNGIEGTNPIFSVREDVSSLEISFPKMSKETRADLFKATKKQAEQARQHVRRVRQDAMNHLKKMKENVSEDDVEVQRERIQKITNSAIADIDKLLAAKEKDLNSV